MSVNEVIFELSKMEGIVEKNSTEYFAAVPKKVEKIVDLFRDNDTYRIKMGGSLGSYFLSNFRSKES